MRATTRLGLVIAAVLVVAVGVVVFAYAFGVVQQGGAAGSPAAPALTAGAGAQAGPEAVPAGQGAAPPADPSSPLAIEIPGCVCHSDDPALVEQHAAYRMNQCAGCHLGGVPTGQ